MGQAMSAGSSADEELFPYEQVTDFADRMPEGFVMRPLQVSDYDKGFLELLSQLTTVGDVSREKFEAHFRSMKHTDPQAYFVVVIEELRFAAIIPCIL
ncbi:hypothetical protein AAVH_29385 [Aphelenchoides avenae]|nr:hypothetical protein AAVH_29385 [Aphelenchus avenae]